MRLERLGKMKILINIIGFRLLHYRIFPETGNMYEEINVRRIITSPDIDNRFG
jgi:hypothetical protein